MDRIDALRLFIQVAEAGSFSRVARERAVATSTVTLAVGQLEQAFGVRLMVRSTRRLALTHEGESLLGDARRIVAEWDSTTDSLKPDGRLSGPIRVTATNDFGRVRLRPLLDAFQAQHPGVTLHLMLDDSTLDLIGERVDVAVRYGPLPDSGLRARLLLPSQRIVCAAPAYWRRHGLPLHPDDLTRHNCLVLARPGAPLAQWPFKDGERTFHVRVRGDRQTTDGDVLRAWGEEGVGVILKNRCDIARALSGGLLAPVLESYAVGRMDLFAVFPGGAPQRVTALVDFLATALHERAQEMAAQEDAPSAPAGIS